MAFQVSPGVQVKELDLTSIVPTIATTPAGFVGVFEWGPANEVVTISSENELRERFGLPNDENGQYWFTASSFLRYGSNLQVVRAEPTATSRNASYGDLGQFGVTGAFPIPFDFSTQKTGSAPWANSDYGQVGAFVARYPGKVGNGVGVAVWDAAASGEDGADGGDFSQWGPAGSPGLWADYIVGGTPDTSLSALNRTGSSSFNDELHIIVYDADGSVTGVKNTPLEIYEGVSKAVDARLSDGTSNYYRTRINNLSDWIFATRAVETANPTGYEQTINDVWLSGPGGSGGAFGAFFNAENYSDNFVLGLTLDYAGVSGDGFTGDNAIGAVITGYSGATVGVGRVLSWADAVNSGGETFQSVTIDVSSGEFLAGGTWETSFTGDPSGLTGLTGGISTVTAEDDALASFPGQLRDGIQLSGGSSIGEVGSLQAGLDAAISTQWEDNFDTLSTDVSFLVAGPADTTLASKLVTIAETRKDCIAVISPELDDVMNPSTAADSIIGYRDGVTPKSSYAVMDTGWKVVYDQYRDTYRACPLNGDIAGLMVRTDEDSEPWFSPAGFNRGRLRNVVKLYYSPGKTDRDKLYIKGINPVVNFENEGIVLFGDKTMQAKPSAFDRINVRRLFNILEKSIATASNFSLFEFNDDFTRASFRNLVEPFLRDVQARRGVQDFKVVCDETNNTAAVIDRNEFVADIYVKPNRSTNFITLNFIATPTGVDFTEIGA